VPESEAGLASALEKLDRTLAAGKNVVVHCRQGIGRTGLVAACLLAAKGMPPEVAVKTLSTSRGVAVPETAGQRDWIDRFAASVVAAR
jgi:protein-tyrosine phosphatase